MAFFIGLLVWFGLFEAIGWLFSVEVLQVPQYAACLSAAVMFIMIGIMHFIKPKNLEYMVSGLLPAPRFWIYFTGLLEVVLGIGLLVLATKIYAAWGLIVLLIAMFPANIRVAVKNLPPPGGLSAKPWYVWSRLFFQPVYIAWLYWVAII